MTDWKVAAAAVLAFALAGCESEPIKQLNKDFMSLLPKGESKPEQTKAQQMLASGIRQYDEANYAEANRLLQASLDQGLAAASDQVRAHKYLAFIHCVSGRQPQCRSEFRQALEIDPSFELASSEAGHPMWGPVFRSVKAQH